MSEHAGRRAAAHVTHVDRGADGAAAVVDDDVFSRTHVQGTAEDVDAPVGVHAVVGGAALYRAAAIVDHDPAVGVDAVADSGGDVERAAVEGKDGDAIFVDVDAIFIGGDVHGAAVDGQVQIGVQPLIRRADIEHTRAGAAARDIHGNVGIKRAVGFQALFLHAGAAALVLGFEQAVDVGAAEGVG